MKNKFQRGEITTALLIAVAVGSLLVGFMAPKLNPLKSLFGGNDSAASKKVSFTNQYEKVEPKVFRMKDGEVLVVPNLETSYNTGMDYSVPKPTFGQRIGNWFFGATTTTIIFLLISIFCFGGAPLFFLWKRAKQFKETLKKQIEGTRKLKEKDPVAYASLTNELAITHDKQDKIVIDKLKTELN